MKALDACQRACSARQRSYDERRPTQQQQPAHNAYRLIPRQPPVQPMTAPQTQRHHRQQRSYGDQHLRIE